MGGEDSRGAAERVNENETPTSGIYRLTTWLRPPVGIVPDRLHLLHPVERETQGPLGRGRGFGGLARIDAIVVAVVEEARELDECTDVVLPLDARGPSGALPPGAR
jgi:hypothetical protein